MKEYKYSIGDVIFSINKYRNVVEEKVIVGIFDEGVGIFYIATLLNEKVDIYDIWTYSLYENDIYTDREKAVKVRDTREEMYLKEKAAREVGYDDLKIAGLVSDLKNLGFDISKDGKTI